MIDSLVTLLIGMSGGHAALAIVLFTVAVRLLLLPLSVRQARAARITERLAPKVRALRERFGRNPERLAREMSALYSKEGSSPMAALLPGLAQAPFMWLVYRVATHPTALAGHDLFGAPLGQQIAGIVTNYGLISWPVSVFILVIALVMLVAWLQARRIAATLPEDQPAYLRRIMPLMPFGSVLAALVLPLAAGLYLLVSTGWTYGERTVLNRRFA
ncbi:membrane protein insertase YidC [Nonomuraea sp. NPDC050691]|uniref:YidC/Oxa1 family membrane protein insertase n=1 Tax=Nonomuraea sp. NPDC050691 TaxID=3155661 RepID=UPI0034025DDF